MQCKALAVFHSSVVHLATAVKLNAKANSLIFHRIKAHSSLFTPSRKSPLFKTFPIQHSSHPCIKKFEVHMALIIEILIVKNCRLVHSYKHSEGNLLHFTFKEQYITIHNVASHKAVIFTLALKLYNLM